MFIASNKNIITEYDLEKMWKNCACTICLFWGRLYLKCDGTWAETRFRLSEKRTSPFNPLNTKLNPIYHLLALLGAHPILHVSKIRVKSAGGSVQSTTGRRAVHISVQALHFSCKPVFCSHVTLTGYPLHSLVSPSLLHPCVTVCHHVSNAVY
jgi:hypothetical protein